MKLTYEIVRKKNLINKDGHCTIPGNYTEIGDGAFWKRTNLKSIIIPNSVIKIRDNAFCGCTSLKLIEFNNVEIIGEYAFSNCTSLELIKLPNNLKSIGSCTFYDCASLVSIELPNNLEVIEGHVFDGCTSLPKLGVDKEMLEMALRDNYFEQFETLNDCFNKIIPELMLKYKKPTNLKLELPMFTQENAMKYANGIDEDKRVFLEWMLSEVEKSSDSIVNPSEDLNVKINAAESIDVVKSATNNKFEVFKGMTQQGKLIKYLEDLGGNNVNDLDGVDVNSIYWINEVGIIESHVLTDESRCLLKKLNLLSQLTEERCELIEGNYYIVQYSNNCRSSFIYVNNEFGFLAGLDTKGKLVIPKKNDNIHFKISELTIIPADEGAITLLQSSLRDNNLIADKKLLKLLNVKLWTCSLGHPIICRESQKDEWKVDVYHSFDKVDKDNPFLCYRHEQSESYKYAIPYISENFKYIGSTDSPEILDDVCYKFV